LSNIYNEVQRELVKLAGKREKVAEFFQACPQMRQAFRDWIAAMWQNGHRSPACLAREWFSDHVSIHLEGGW
jgi:hypothetical protein